jgi:CRP-like cAMP-binding protein
MSEHAASLAGLPGGRIDDVAVLLSRVELFDGLAESDLAGIASVFKRVRLTPGELLWRQATPPDGLYFLLEGEVQVCRQLPGERELELARLRSGEVMGEIPLLGGAGNHSASVRAIGHCTLLRLRRVEFEAHVIAGDPAALELKRRIVAIACARLRDSYRSLVTEHQVTGLRDEPQAEPLPAMLPPRSYLSRLPLFRRLDPDFVADLLTRGRAISLPRGCVVQHEGDQPDACYVVLNGAMEDVLCRGSASRRVGFAGPGHVVGGVGLLDGEPAPVSSVARERTVLLAIDREHFAALQNDFGVSSREFTTAIEADVLRSLETAERALSHLATARMWQGVAPARPHVAPASTKDERMAPCTLDHSNAVGPLAPDHRTRVEQIKRVMQLEIELAELRGASQPQVAEESSRHDIGRIEREIDVIQLPMFQRYVEVLGAKLEVQAIFDDLDITDIKLSG